MKKLRIILTPVLILAFVAIGTGCGEEQIGPSISPTLLPWTGEAKVQTLYGPVKGTEDASDTWVWKAIPYAKPPVGSLRWKAPQDPEPWTDTREETEFCSQCPQYNISSAVVGSEDCLYLNIWRPQSDETNLPVYFWIHGGGNSGGTASDDAYKGANIAGESKLVVVTANYRLGPLGWFTHSALRGDDGDELDDSGNYGTLDIIKALAWVSDNIEAFGGDPANVTIAGESAGAMNVFSLLISPLAQGLFHRAVAQSGIPISSSVTNGEESARAVILKLLINDGAAADQEAAQRYLDRMTNAEVEAYLMSRSPAELLAGYDNMAFGMISFPFLFQDGVVIPDAGFATLTTGTYPSKVPIIIGSNKEETKLFLFLDPAFVGKDELYQAVSAYTSDLWKAIGVDGVARKLRANANQPDVYVYQFLWGAGGDIGESVIPAPWGFKLGACHGLDVPFFFGNDELFGPLALFIFTEENRPGREALTSAMMAYVAQFVRTGNPNDHVPAFPEWKPWSNAVDEPKCVLLDADKDDVRIEMSALEVTESDVKEAIGPEVLEYLSSESMQFLLQFAEQLFGLEVGE